MAWRFAHRCDFESRRGVVTAAWRLQLAVDRFGNTCKDCGDEIIGQCGGGSRAVLLSVLRGSVLWYGRGWRNAVTG